MRLADSLAQYVRACFTGIWIVSHEHEDALTDISHLCQEEEWRLATWDLEAGLQVTGSGAGDRGASDPLAAIRALSALGGDETTSILVLINVHRLFSPEVIQALLHQLALGKQRRTFVVVLAPVLQLPPELERQFIVLEHDLPGRDQLLTIAQGLVEADGDLPEGAELERVLDAAAGLTRHEAEGAFALALTRHERIVAETVWDLKAQSLLKGGLVQLYRGRQRFEDLGGLEALKAFALRALRKLHQDVDRRAKGVLLLGVPGTGKSAFAKALGNETDRPALVLDIGSLMAGIVGATEERTRHALKIIDAMAPAVLFIDEIEKGLSGASGSSGDSGVASRLFGTLLTWFNDHESDIFVVATCNDISRLPPEFSRAERFDGVFFLDLPSPKQKQAIWNLYLEQFELEPAQKRPADEDWTGAEIRSCCRLAALLDLPLVAAAQNVVPVARTAGESIDRLRQWASGRCLDAERGGIYQLPGAGPTSRRRIARGRIDPSAN